MSAEYNANWLSRGVWWWISPLLRLGYQRPLQLLDLGALDAQDESGRLADHLTQGVRALRADKDPSVPYVSLLWRVLAWSDAYIMALAGLGKLLGDLLGFVSPVALSGIIHFCAVKADGKNDDVWPSPGTPGSMELGYWWMIAAFASALLQNFFLHQHHHYAIRAGMHVRSALTVAVYRKSLRLSGSAKNKFGAGQIQNLASVDASAVGIVWWYIHYAWAAPLQLGICIAMLYSQLGLSSLVGLAVLLALLPTQAWMAQAIAAASKRTLTHSDTRVKLINEIVSGIRILKFMGWEDSFADRVASARGREVHEKRRVAFINAANTTLLDVGPLLVALLTFLTYGYTAGEPLTSSRAFTSLSLYSILRLPLMVGPMLVGCIASAKVSGQRLADFLDGPEQEEYRAFERRDGENGNGSTAAVEMVHATLTWQDSSQPKDKQTEAKGKDNKAQPLVVAGDETKPFALSDLTLAFPRGKLTTIVGPVGSGKSSILSAILGEMRCTSGTMVLRTAKGTGQDGGNAGIAYCSQQPWIINASVRDNITFGSAMDRTRYDSVLHACALLPDLAMLPAGDDTEIGERGVNLSGGQKARISLARALYSSCELVLLDDVLSAVDAHVAQHLWTHALTGPHGLAGRTVILVSHQLQFLPSSDLVVVMDGGRPVQVGHYTELMAQQPASSDSTSTSSATSDGSVSAGVPATPVNKLAFMMAERRRVDNELSAARAGQEGQAPASEGESRPSGSSGPGPSQSTDRTSGSATPVSPSASQTGQDKDKDATIKSPAAAKPSAGKTMSEEDRATGSVPGGIYWTYLSSMGPVALVVILAALAASNASRIGTDWWLGLWSSDSLKAGVGFYVGIYAAITGATSLITLLMGLAWATGGMRAALVLHSHMFARVLRSPVSFFDTTPAGRILNRFSSDISVVDKDLPTSFSSYSKLATGVIGTVVVQAVILPWTLLASAPIAVMFILIQTYFRASAREVKRLDAVTKSPVFAHLAESLVGLPSIRAYAATAPFVKTAQDRLDTNNIANWTSNVMNRWLGLRLDALGSLLVGGVCLVAVLTAGQINPGLIGLAVAYSMNVTGTLNWLVRSGSEVEQYLASVERIVSYSQLPQEAPADIPSNKPAANWPSKGAVTVSHLNLRYRPGLPLVLKDVSFTIPGGHKVGVCGRTGSGKSSLMLALFRIVEAEGADGGSSNEDGQGTTKPSITIDGVEIGAIGLTDLRSRLAIIPQDPTLFTGTIRYNLDPTAEGQGDKKQTHGQGHEGVNHTNPMHAAVAAPGPIEVTTSDPDARLWSALAKVRLDEVVKAMGGLDAKVEDGGSNLSVGQRQLLCMARALLRGSKLIVLDEATASVDVQTDSLIQTMLRTAFSGSTAFVIAHRINTILDCDTVLVLEDGRLIEHGPPQKLLRTEGSAFARLVHSSAEATAKAAGGSAAGEGRSQAA